MRHKSGIEKAQGPGIPKALEEGGLKGGLRQATECGMKTLDPLMWVQTLIGCAAAMYASNPSAFSFCICVVRLEMVPILQGVYEFGGNWLCMWESKGKTDSLPLWQMPVQLACPSKEGLSARETSQHYCVHTVSNWVLKDRDEETSVSILYQHLCSCKSQRTRDVKVWGVQDQELVLPGATYQRGQREQRSCEDDDHQSMSNLTKGLTGAVLRDLSEPFHLTLSPPFDHLCLRKSLPLSPGSFPCTMRL